VAQAVDETAKTHGRIDVLFCCAGIAEAIAAEDYPAQNFQKILNVNFFGVFYACQAVGKHMIERGGGGSIIAMGSIAGHVVVRPQKQCAYNASKAAVIHLCKSLAAEWAPHKIRVNTISPGYMDTILCKDPGFSRDIWLEQIPLARMGEIDEINGTAVYLASDASSYATGTDVLVDGGLKAW